MSAGKAGRLAIELDIQLDKKLVLPGSKLGRQRHHTLGKWIAIWEAEARTRAKDIRRRAKQDPRGNRNQHLIEWIDIVVIIVISLSISLRADGGAAGRRDAPG